MYVDDCFVIGNKQAIKKALDDVEGHFDIKRSGEISDFIGCSIEQQDNWVLLSQPDLINKLIKTFESKISRCDCMKPQQQEEDEYNVLWQKKSWFLLKNNQNFDPELDNFFICWNIWGQISRTEFVN